jgi:hypothetical protein
MTWNPLEHPDEENLRWAWLRAVEWGRWPIFLSQVYAPVLLLFISWKWVVGLTIGANLAWLGGRFLDVNVQVAFLGALVTQVKWLTWIPCTALMFWLGRSPEDWICLFWFVLIFPMGMFPPVQIGAIQKRFMEKLGYLRP